MKCTRCGSELPQAAMHVLTGEVRGEQVAVAIEAPRCDTCGHVAIRGKTMNTFARRAADAYRERKGLLTSEHLQYARKRLGMTWSEFADHLLIGPATLKRWLRGEIQSAAYDQLVRLKTDLDSLEAEVARLTQRLSAASTATRIEDPEFPERTRRERSGRKMRKRLWGGEGSPEASLDDDVAA